jgi:glycosyltransferase involved in cell wall biosynthesis
MRRAKVLVNTSHTGSVDKVVLEAMACGTIPLTCNESFVRIFGDELAPRLMFDRGDPATLALRLREVLSLPPDERADLGRRLSEYVAAEHDLSALVPRMVASMEKAP